MGGGGRAFTLLLKLLCVFSMNDHFTISLREESKTLPSEGKTVIAFCGLDQITFILKTHRPKDVASSSRF